MKTVPLEKDISHFIDYKSFVILSEKQYASYVQREADKRKEWAVEMLESVERVSSFWTFWTTHVDLVSRREIVFEMQRSLLIPPATRERVHTRKGVALRGACCFSCHSLHYR